MSQDPTEKSATTRCSSAFAMAVLCLGLFAMFLIIVVFPLWACWSIFCMNKLLGAFVFFFWLLIILGNWEPGDDIG